MQRSEFCSAATKKISHTFVLNSLKSLRRDTHQTRISSTHWYSTLQSLQIKSTLSRHIFCNYSLLSLHLDVFSFKTQSTCVEWKKRALQMPATLFRKSKENVYNCNWCIKFKLFVSENLTEMGEKRVQVTWEDNFHVIRYSWGSKIQLPISRPPPDENKKKGFLT